MHLRHPLPLVSLLLVPAAAHGQKLIHTNIGDQAQLRLGDSVAGAGDVDGDGFDDYLSGTRNQSGGAGGVWVFSGKDGSLLFNLVGNPGEGIGHAVAGFGDLNGDGHDDFAAGAPTAGSGGLVRVWSGLDGSVLLELNAATSGDRFGESLCGLEDLDGDFVPDFAIGAEIGGANTGQVTVHSGATGVVLQTLSGANNQDSFGASVSAVADLDGDGREDLLVGSDRDDDQGSASGRVAVVNPATGVELYSVVGDSAGDELGRRVSGVADLNGDGRGDFLAATDADYVRVYSGIDGSVLMTVTDPAAVAFGSEVAGLGDVDGDGRGDFLVNETTWNTNRGAVHLYSGATGSRLLTIGGTFSAGGFGSALAAGGDINADGLPDWIIGADGVDIGGGNAGLIEVIGGAREIGTRYCSPGNPNSTGQAGRIRAFGSDLVADQCLTLAVDRLPAGEFAFCLASKSQGSIMPANSQGILCLAGNIARFNRPTELLVGPIAELDVDMTAIPANPDVAILAGETWNFTCWYRDTNPAPTNNFTDAIQVPFL